MKIFFYSIKIKNIAFLKKLLSLGVSLPLKVAELLPHKKGWILLNIRLKYFAISFFFLSAYIKFHQYNVNFT